jgi:hypothetical protein
MTNGTTSVPPAVGPSIETTPTCLGDDLSSASAIRLSNLKDANRSLCAAAYFFASTSIILSKLVVICS